MSIAAHTDPKHAVPVKQGSSAKKTYLTDRPGLDSNPISVIAQPFFDQEGDMEAALPVFKDLGECLQRQAVALRITDPAAALGKAEAAILFMTNFGAAPSEIQMMSDMVEAIKRNRGTTSS